jgi:hypothetical protein
MYSLAPEGNCDVASGKALMILESVWTIHGSKKYYGSLDYLPSLWAIAFGWGLREALVLELWQAPIRKIN